MSASFSSQPAPQEDLHALLIGIDHYAVPQGSTAVCSDLYGAVADVRAMRQYLLSRGTPPANLRILVSPHDDEPGADPPDNDDLPSDGLPTYQRMVHEIQALEERAANSGRRALLYYSGHGGLAKTWLSDAKGVAGVDAGLVPYDISLGEPQMLRGVELTYLLDKMVRRGVGITVILDACHSGGAMRTSTTAGPTSSVRQRRALNRLGDSSPSSSAVATPEQLRQVWRRVHNREYDRLKTVFRKATYDSGWLCRGMAQTAGVVVLSASREHEPAVEDIFDGDRRGVMTYFLLDILQDETFSQASAPEVCAAIVKRLQEHGQSQQPLLSLESSTECRGLFSQPVTPAAVSLDDTLGLRASRVLLRADDLDDKPARPVMRDGRPRQTITSDLQQELHRLADPLLDLVVETSESPDMVVSCRRHSLQILLPDGTPIPHLPAVPGSAKEVAPVVVQKLQALARFDALRRLVDSKTSIPHRESILKGTDLKITLKRLPDDFVRGNDIKEKTTEFTDERSPQGDLRLTSPCWIAAEIHNSSFLPLHVGLLDLQPEGAIQILGGNKGNEVLAAKKTLWIPLRITLGPGFEGGRETLRLIASKQHLKLQGLEQVGWAKAACGQSHQAPAAAPQMRGGGIRKLDFLQQLVAAPKESTFRGPSDDPNPFSYVTRAVSFDVVPQDSTSDQDATDMPL